MPRPFHLSLRTLAASLGAALLAVALLAIPPASASAQPSASRAQAAVTIHVANFGDDASGDGSFDRPYQSLKGAVDSRTVPPGSRIVLRGGTYALTESQAIKLTGAAGRPIVITSFDRNRRPILDGTNINPRSNYQDPIIQLYESAHVVIDGLTVRNSESRGIAVWHSDHITIRNNHVHNIASRAIGGSADNMTIDNNRVWQAVLENDWGTLDPDVQNWAAAISTWHHQDGAPVRNLRIINNDVSEVWGEGIIALFADGAEVRGNSVRDTYSVNIYLDHTRNATVDGNFVASSNRNFDRVSNGVRRAATGISMANERYATQTVAPPNLAGITITNNLLLRTGDGIRYWHDRANREPNNSYRNIVIANNTLHGYTGRGISASAVAANSAEPRAVRVVNNSIDAPDAGQAALELGDPAAWSFANNNWVGGIPSQGSHPASLRVDPAFVNPNGGQQFDFRIQPTSRLVAAGIAANAPAVDYFGARRANPPAIGFHEAERAMPTCQGRTATVVGTGGADTLRGTHGVDVIVAGAGDDKIYGLRGDDVICAGPGDDLVYAGDGADVVLGSDGTDRLYGGPGADRIIGGAGQDRLWGGGGNDSLVGNDGNDELAGGDGVDVLAGGNGNDGLYGGSGDDTLAGGAGRDFCHGGPGADRGNSCEQAVSM